MIPSSRFPESFVVWDTETTGLDVKTAKIIEVACIRVKDGVVVSKWSHLLNWEVDVPEDAFAIHGISREMCESEGQPPLAVIGMLNSEFMAADNTIVTHNGSRYDLPLLEELTHMWPKRTMRHVDTAAIYKSLKMFGAERQWFETADAFNKRVLDARVPVKFNLGAACDDLGIDRSGVVHHRAMGDAELTLALYQKLCL